MPRLRLLPVGAAAIWLAALTAGQLWIAAYQFSPGRIGTAPSDWPAESSVRPVAGKSTLLVFVHPRCPCTRSALREMERVATRFSETLQVHIVLVTPRGAPPDWIPDGLHLALRKIPGAEVSTDCDGQEAMRFGAVTSGMVQLYDPQGRLTFRGGITAGRGHEGDNPGLSALIARLSGDGTVCREYAVYGCPLIGEEASVTERAWNATP
jgi:hypothetical protein